MARSISGKRKVEKFAGDFTTPERTFYHRNPFEDSQEGFCDFLLILLSWLQEPKQKQDLPRKCGRLWGLDRARIFLNKPFKVPSIYHWVCAARRPRGTWGTQHHLEKAQMMPIKLRRDSWTEGSLSGKAAGHRNPEPTTHPAHVHPGWEAADVLHATEGTFHS